MSVTARSNLPGVHTYWKTNHWTSSYRSTYWEDLYVDKSEGNESYVDHECQRSAPVKVVPRLLTENGPVWRDPTDYARHVVDKVARLGTHERHVYGYNYRGTPYEEHQFRDWTFMEDLFAWDFMGSRFSIAGGGPAFPENEENLVLAKALSKLKDRRASLGENLAEAGKTYRTLTHELGNLLFAARSVKRGNYGLAAKWLRDRRGLVRRGADTYLQYKFGWQPLMNDIYGLTELLKEQCKPALLMSVREDMPWVDIDLLPKSGTERTGSVRQSGHCKLTGMVTGAHSNLPNRLGLDNPLSLGWDLIPWSFVVDWALPVGDVLDAMTAPLGLDFVGGYTAARFEGELTSRQLPDWGWTEVSPRLNTYRVFSFMRRTYNDWPYVGLYVKSPFTMSHGITSMALLIQQILH